MTFLAQVQPMVQIAGASHCRWPITPLDRDDVAREIADAGWSVDYHEAPDHETCLVVLPDEDDALPTFVLSVVRSVVGSQFRLEECRNDALRGLGDYSTLGEAVAALLDAMASQARTN
jgi:hypothetical protein